MLRHEKCDESGGGAAEWCAKATFAAVLTVTLDIEKLRLVLSLSFIWRFHDIFPNINSVMEFVDLLRRRQEK